MTAHPRQHRRPAMTDVARSAGVSHQTVSRVLNGHPSVSPQTRALVLTAIDDLGYRPNTTARALATGLSQTLGIITIAGNYYGPSSTLYGVEGAARDAGYAVTVVNLPGPDPRAMQEAADRLLAQRVAGIVAVVPLTSASEGLHRFADDVPCVIVEGLPGSDQLNVVRVDQEVGARMATEHLLALGHATVWHVCGPTPDEWPEAGARLATWRRVLEEQGRPVPPALPGDWSARSGYEAGKIIARATDCTAVFVANDQMALGVLRALRESGRRVPEDVSLVGFDDIPEAEFFWPPLTTVRQDFAAVGRQSLRALIEQIDSGERRPADVVLAPEFVVRASTARPSRRTRRVRVVQERDKG